MTVLERIYYELDKQGLRPARLCEAVGISSGLLSTWKKRGTEPGAKYIPSIAEFLGVSEKYLLTGEEVTDTEAMAEKLHKDPSLKMLFDAADGAAPEDLELAAEMLKKMKKSSGYDV
ncbi:MAG: hypothetical protein HFE75_04925 [Firmicutes bacterium]|nr:hypothetical protein [Bacillota bacterium]